MRQERALKVRWVLLVVVMCMLFGLGMGVPSERERNKAPGYGPFWGAMRDRDPNAPGHGLRINHALNLDYHMADVSLAVREQVDFLLTPALLAQEAVSEDIVLTYPEE
jgi:hypothetical protein